MSLLPKRKKQNQRAKFIDCTKSYSMKAESLEQLHEIAAYLGETNMSAVVNALINEAHKELEK